MKSRRAPFTCPVCGADVSPNSKACSECGACDKSGWSSDADAGGLDLPDDEFDYEKFVAEEFGRSPKPAGMSWMWWAVAGALLVAFGVMAFVR